MNNMSIRFKLLLGFMIIAILSLTFSLYTVWEFYRVKVDFTNIVDKSIPRVQALLEMKNSSKKVSEMFDHFRLMNENNQAIPLDEKDYLLASLEDIDRWQKTYEAHRVNGNTTLNKGKLGQLRDAVILASIAAFSAHEKNSGAEAEKEAAKQLMSAHLKLDDYIKNAFAEETLNLEKANKAVIRTANNLYIMLIISGISLLVLTFMIAVYLSRHIANPIIALSNFSKNITHSNLSDRVTVNGSAEINQLAHSLNNMLDNLVRTKKQLLQASRMAGMSEVAAEMLHNVGNVLNSVNTSIFMLREKNELSKVNELVRLNEMLQSHRGDLAEYLTSDEHGKLILPYLVPLSQTMRQEHEFSKNELDQLIVNLEHIHTVVRKQQSYNTFSGVVENVSLSTILQEVVDMFISEIHEKGIVLECKWEQSITLETIGDKLKQAIIVIVDNAIDALSDIDKEDKRIIIHAETVDEMVVCDISDNGTGIAESDIEQVFRFGFTKKSNGYGFSLHASACTIHELGGEITIASKGLGYGATFSLKLPVTLPASHQKLKHGERLEAETLVTNNNE